MKDNTHLLYGVATRINKADYDKLVIASQARGLPIASFIRELIKKEISR